MKRIRKVANIGKGVRAGHSPVAYWDGGGVARGIDGSAWLYLKVAPGVALDTAPLEATLDWQAGLLDVLRSLAGMVEGNQRTAAKSTMPECHLVAVDHPVPTVVPETDDPARLGAAYQEWLAEQVSFERVVALGVKLSVGVGNRYDRSLENLVAVLSRHIAAGTLVELNPMELAILEGWPAGPTLNLRKVTKFERERVTFEANPVQEWTAVACASLGVPQEANDVAQLEVARSTWLFAAQLLRSDARCVSMRFRLEPARLTERVVDSRIKANQASLQTALSGGARHRGVAELKRAIEVDRGIQQTLIERDLPTAVGLEITAVRQAGPNIGAWLSGLPGAWRVATDRQRDALMSCLPAGGSWKGPRVEPQAPFVSQAGWGHLASGGDTEGALALVGWSADDRRPVWLNLRAPERSGLPVSFTLGSTGSGKTFKEQGLIAQALDMGLRCVFVNLKFGDSRQKFADAVGGKVINVSELSELDGPLDPFRVSAVEPEERAQLAITWLRTVMGDAAVMVEARLDVEQAFRRAAVGGAACLEDAFAPQWWDSQETRERLHKAARKLREAPAVAACWGLRPDAAEVAFADGLTVIEPGDTPLQAEDPITVGLLTLVLAASQQAMRARPGVRGGTVVVDEAHVLLKAGDGRGAAILASFARIARSLGVAIRLISQRPEDFVKAGASDTLEDYVHSISVGRFPDVARASWEAACQLAGIDAKTARKGSQLDRIEVGGKLVRGQLWYVYVDGKPTVLTEVRLPETLREAARADARQLAESA